MPQRTVLVFAVLLLSLSGIPALAEPLDAQRAVFLKAREALEAKQLDAFRQLRSQLTDYPLYSYLEYWRLSDRKNFADNASMEAFLEQYSDQPISALLRKRWLKWLAQRQKWRQFLAQYRGMQSSELQCYRLQALLKTGQKQQLAEQALDLWLVGHSQDKACDPVFSYLEDQDKITDELRWQRIRLAMEEGQTTLAGYLARRLPEEDRTWVTLWREAHRLPASTLDSGKLRQDSEHAREIVLHAIRRLAGFDETTAHDRWQEIGQRYSFLPEERAAVERDIALIAAWRHNPQAHDWLSELPDSAADAQVHEWRTRTAISQQLWPAILRHIANMPAELAESDEWRYWRAIALEKTGGRELSSDLLAALAGERNYHGFLAADQLGWPYVMDNRPLAVSEQRLAELADNPAFVRARELYLAGLMTEARREWHAAIAGLDADGLRAAARLAQSWGWHDRAILTVARSADYDDLVMRFPLEHEEDIEQSTRRYRLDPGHVLAVIRTESAFNPDARSGAGAMGLMQLMPATGRSTARKYGIPLPGTRHLYEVAKNIRIGTAYLKQVMDQYQDNMVLASAAYNAGPQRVRRWLPEQEQMPARNWIAAIPFNETRNYVQRILVYTAIYNWRLENPVTPLTRMMPDVKPRDSYG